MTQFFTQILSKRADLHFFQLIFLGSIIILFLKNDSPVLVAGGNTYLTSVVERWVQFI